MLNMNGIVGDYDIVFLTLDTLRYDVAFQERKAGRLPVLGRYFSQWEQRHSPGSFTYASHQAFFSGFFPTPIDNPAAPRPLAVEFAGSTSISPNTKCFQAATIVEGLANEGYHTVCIGGVGFFNKQTPLGNVLPDLFEESHWTEKMGVTCEASTEHQIQQALVSLGRLKTDQRVFLFINISAIHQPNYFYDTDSIGEGGADDIDSHAAALRYVDSQLQPLFEAFRTRRNTLFFVSSDHGTTYGENGYTGHRLAHDCVWTVPYVEFIQEAILHD
ncbi:metalloenzyme domain-containing protein [Gammaproteobacteria bacterium 45_16_T64]|nr:metalloenzyme domain-containing protein [Gammaproteobacteria bacterium 45_16_T64]